MSKLIVLVLVFGAFDAIRGQPMAPDDCLMKCTNAHYQKSPRSDAMKMANVQKVKVGDNTTAMCPQIGKNETDTMEVTCAALIELKNCTDSCPDTPIKKMTMSAFKSQQFVCVDRFIDFKENMPCLSRACPDVQRACAPKCGTFESNAEKIVNLIHRVQGDGRPPAAGPPGTNVTPAPAKDVDMSAITKAIADTCTAITCFTSCSEPMVTKQCGKDAFLFQRDFTWNIFSTVAQSMSSMGIQTQWPDECKALASGNATNAIPSGGTTVSGPVAATTVPIIAGAGNLGVVVGATNGSTIPSSKAGNGTNTGASTGSAGTSIPSIVLLFLTIFLAFK
jgi:hypothetical protein